jgi:dienelactone hydrolase
MTRRPIVALTALFLGLLGLTACSNPSAPANANASVNRSTAVPPAAPTDPVDPDAPQSVSFTTEEGVKIAGDLYMPEKSPAPAILALHQWQADRSTYREFARAMRGAGFVVLIIDGPGFGESTEGIDGKVTPDWTLTSAIDAAIDYLEAQPAVDALRIGLVGASYGASNALIYAADHPANVRSVALLSVGLNYNNTLPTEPAIKAYGNRPLLMVAARDDAQSATDTEKLAAIARNARHRTKIYDAGGHGTKLLAPSVGGTKLLESFFVETLTGPIATRVGPGEGSENAEGGGAAPDTEDGEQEPEGKP